MVLKALKVLELASQAKVIFIIILIFQVIIVAYIFEFLHLKILVVEFEKVQTHYDFPLFLHF
jgi:hypothetical protein